MKKQIIKKFFIAISLCLIFLLAKDFIFSRLNLTFYKQHEVIDYFHSNKSDFKYIAKNIQKEDLIDIEKVENKIIFSIDKRIEKNGIEEREYLYKNDEELKSSCENLFNGKMKVKSIWIEEYLKDESINVVKIRFLIQSIISSRKIQGIYYFENLEPASEVKSKYMRIENNWYYFEEDGDDLMGD